MAAQFVTTCCVVLLAFSAAAATSSLGLNLHGSSASAHVGEHHDVQADTGTKHKHSLLAQTPQIQQQLVICNAYASPKKLEVVQVRTRQSLTEGSPLAYKQCKDFSLPLEDGDQLDFKAGNLDVGTFYATGLPKSSTSLLLVPHRRSPTAVGIKFESHAFADVQSPQIAVVDAFHGKSDQEAGTVKIIESLLAAGEIPAEEELKFNSVVAVNPGKYGVSLSSLNASFALPLSAEGMAKCVILRVGVEGGSKHGEHYPQELIVFPSTAVRTVIHLSIILVAVAACVLGLL